MIINISGRTDIVGCYGEWLMDRFREGFVYTRNPLFPKKVTRYELSKRKVDALLFTSKNYAPFLEHLARLSEDYRLFCHYTITAYGRDVEPNVPDLETSVKTLYEVEKIVGKERLAWRFDPVLCTPRYPPRRLLNTFEGLCAALSGHVDRCVVSFVEMHIKLQRNMPELIPLTAEDKKFLAEGLGRIAKKYRIPIHSCGGRGDFGEYGIESVGCVTLPALGRANGCVFSNVQHLGNRRGCLCIRSRDLGAYDSCPHGCRYCYANTDPQLTLQNISLHERGSPLLIGNLTGEDELINGNQRSFLKRDRDQISLFDL